MATNLFVIACLVILSSTTTIASDDVVVKLVNHIERLDAKIEQLEKRHVAELDNVNEKAKLREGVLLHKIEELDLRVKTLEAQNSAVMKEKSLFYKKFLKCVALRKEDAIAAKRAIIDEGEKKTTGGKIRSDVVRLSDAGIVKPKRALQSDYHIAFTAYMDHDSNSLGVGQTLINNQMLLNDGNAYNNHTGIFTAPIAGVYSFTFFIGQRDGNQENAGLFVNSSNKVDAIVQTNAIHDDAQGGNSAVLKVNAGDAVFVKSLAGVHVEGSRTFRLTSFSGFLVYPVDDGSSEIVGK